MSNWKAPGKGSVQRYWLKNFTSLHPRIAVQLNCILDGEIPLPDWMTQQSAVDNYRPILCLSLVWKLMTGMLAERMYSLLERQCTMI